MDLVFISKKYSIINNQNQHSIFNVQVLKLVTTLVTLVTLVTLFTLTPILKLSPNNIQRSTGFKPFDLLLVIGVIYKYRF